MFLSPSFAVYIFMFWISQNESTLFIFLELVTKGSLASFFGSYHLNDSQVFAYTRQILNGLKYLLEPGVVHR